MLYVCVALIRNHSRKDRNMAKGDKAANTSYATGYEHSHTSTGGKGVTFKGTSSSGKSYASHTSGAGARSLGAKQAARNKTSRK